MPLFVQGQDPLDPSQSPGIVPTGAAQPDPFAGYSLPETAGAEFRQNNPVVSVINALNSRTTNGTIDPTYNVIDDIKGTHYEADHLSDFIGVPNKASADALKARIDGELRDREIDASAGWAGHAIGLASGVLDPTLYVPLVGEAELARGAYGIARTAGRMAALGAVQSATSEAALQASQLTRSRSESFANIASNTLLMGFLGAGAGAMLSRGERAAASAGLDEVRANLTPEVPADVAATTGDVAPADPLVATPSAVPDRPAPPAGTPAGDADVVGGGADAMAGADDALSLARAAGAAASDPRQLVLKNYPRVPDWLADTPIAGAVAGKVGDALNGLSPTLRVFSSDSLVAKRAMADLAETPLVFEDNVRGIPTAFGAPPLDRIIKTQSRQVRMAVDDALTDAFVDYRYGANRPSLPVQRATAADVAGRGGGKLSFKDFKGEVAQAMWSGDVHSIPQVELAAKAVRKASFDPVSKLAQSTLGPDGRPMLAEELQAPRGDASYFPRLWNKEAIGARRNELRGTLTDYLQSRQADEARVQDRLRDLQARREDLSGQMSTLERRLDAIRGRQDETVARLKERGQARHETADRDDVIGERRAIAEGNLSEVEAFIEEMHASLRDPALAGRLNELTAERSQLLREDLQGTDYTKLERAGIVHAETEELRHLQGARESMSDAVDVARQDRAGARRQLQITRARQDETARAARANVGRVGLLQERLGRQQMMEDLLEAAHENAAGEHAQVRSRIEDELRVWEGRSSSEAKAALRARDEGERLRGLKQDAEIYGGRGERLTSAAAAVDAAVRRILHSDRDRSRAELSGVADEIIDRLLGSPDGRLPYDAPSGGPHVGPPGAGQEVRGSLNSRDFAIPTDLVKDFVEKDPQHVVAAYLRSVLPDVMLTQRFGDVDMTGAFRSLNEEYAAKVAASSGETAARRIEAERQGMIRDLAATRDRVRGTYGWSPDPRMRNAARIAGAFRNWNLIADLGTSVFNRLGDAGANAVFRHGFMNVFRDGWMPFLKGMVGASALPAEYRAQAKAMATAVDGIMGHMSHDFGDVIDNYRPGSKFERGLSWAADASMLINLHGPWTDWTKTMVSGVASAELLRTAERVATGAASAKDIERLAAASIDRPMAERIWKAFSDKGGDIVEGTPVPNTADWADMSARQAFEAAIGREADIAVITPGMEKPLWMSSPIAGLIGQFKSFVAGAYERLLIANLQQRDARTLQGLLASVATGMVSYRLYSWLAGRDVSDNPADWIKEGVHRSAILAWFSEANELQGRFTAGSTDLYRLIGATRPLTRHDHSALQELLGPTYGRLEGLTGALGDAAHGTWSAGDTHKLRQWMFLQNLFAVRRLLDQAEEGVNGALGVKPRAKAPSWN